MTEASPPSHPREGGAGRGLAPVVFSQAPGDAVSQSLAILQTVYEYNHWVYANVREYLGTSVLEVGAGIGNVTRFMLNTEELVCLEPYAPYEAYLRESLSRHLNVRVVGRSIEDCPCAEVPAEHFDTVVSLNVLEHIADDADAVARCRRLLRPGGRIVLVVPALPAIYGTTDRAMGHVRRYTRRSLRRLFEGAGLMPVRLRYMNVVGAFAWWWEGRVRRAPGISERKTRIFDRCVPVLAAVEQLCPPLLGQSLVAVAER